MHLLSMPRKLIDLKNGTSAGFADPAGYSLLACEGESACPSQHLINGPEKVGILSHDGVENIFAFG